MNNYFNFKIPIFHETYGEDWEDFIDIIEDNTDYVMNKTYQLYWLNDIDYMPVRVVEKILTSLKIGYTATETLASKKNKLRKLLTTFMNKGTSDIYLDYAEVIVGTRGDIYTAYSVGARRWGTTRWGNPSSHSATDMRWTFGNAQFYIFIDVKTTNSALLDEITTVYRQNYLKPAFYQILLIDSSFNILRTI